MSNGRGNHIGYGPIPPRGRGQWRGRGRGRGRGGRGGSRGTFQASHAEIREHLEGELVFDGHFEDFTLGRMTPSGQNWYASPVRGYRGHPYYRGFQYERGRYSKVFRGLGFPASSTQPRIPLSTLEKYRPFLRPIVFVRGEHQKTLFQEVEDILHAPGEEGEAIDDHAPSADIVERIFHREPADEAPPSWDIDSASKSGDHAEMEVARDPPAAEDTAPTFVVDTEPGPVVFFQPSETSFNTPDSLIVGAVPLGDTADDEVIVYEAPHPRLRRKEDDAAAASHVLESNLPPLDVSLSPAQGASSHQSLVSTPIDAVPIRLVLPTDPDLVPSKQVQAHKTIGLKPTPRSRKMAKKERAAARRREERTTLFNMINVGLNMEEREAVQGGPTVKNDPQYAERRRDDSDVDWGTDDEGAIEELRSSIGDMDLDGDVVDTAALARFARGVVGLAGEEVVTIADLDDAARMREEDEGDGNEEASSQEKEEIFDVEERKEIGEHANADSSDSEEDDTPRRSFQGRLQKIRAKVKGKAVADAMSASDGEEDIDLEAALKLGPSWADRDESFVKHIENVLDTNAILIHGSDRKAIQNGEFKDDYETLNMRKKDRDLPPELRVQRERDRAKKAERKRARALSRIQAAGDLSSTPKRSKRKKGKLLGGGIFREDTLYVDSVNDMTVLEELIRTFLGNLDMKRMELPPMAKAWRKRAHFVADAFNLKSKSKGQGEGRFLTFNKTTKSGVDLNEWKISNLVNGNNGGGFHGPERAGTLRHRDGDEVGKMAPRLSDSNVGFKLLKQMGWEEGDRIGATGGLVDPLTAIIKTTKLGLGATR